MVTNLRNRETITYLSATVTQREKMHEHNREEETREQVDILAVEIEDVGPAVSESLAISVLPNLNRLEKK
jgi:hypothetical protein